MILDSENGVISDRLKGGTPSGPSDSTDFVWQEVQLQNDNCFYPMNEQTYSHSPCLTSMSKPDLAGTSNTCPAE